ncbi:hypothetical protein NQ317_000742 [Molorchus minor]|uniref:Tubulin-folding cofactor D ARM repeats domain-containing protein n=1 Tax=Molorchus minor TaxID=1323400 RepID=A0ABQ9JBJ7_9CUCU|nr:hypothetical protein NQ317_000742 [Molorchus minor]
MLTTRDEYDVKEKHMSSFFEWAIELSSNKNSNVFVKYGSLACVATILKHGKREDLLPYTRRLLTWIINAEFKNNSGSNIQKLVYKIVQRIGLTFLCPRVAAWRYKRGNRSLAANLSAGDVPNSSTDTSKADAIAETDVDVPDEVEEVIDQLIQGLRSLDSIVVCSQGHRQSNRTVTKRSWQMKLWELCWNYLAPENQMGLGMELFGLDYKM